MNSALKMEGAAKAFLKQAYANWRTRLRPGYEEILDHAPNEFVRAFQEKKYAKWDPSPMDFGSERWPMFDDDNETWYEVRFEPAYYTDGGRLFATYWEIDSDGNSDIAGEAEVGTEEATELERDFGYAGWQTAMRRYWEWVLENKEDPLGYVRIPRVEVKQNWLAAFVRAGTELRLYAIRQLTEKKPSPPAVLWPDVVKKARTDPDWKEALDYCLVNEAGVTEATEKDMFGDDDLDARWDSKGRLLVNFSTAREEIRAGAQNVIVKAARDALRRLRESLSEGAAKAFLKSLPNPANELGALGYESLAYRDGLMLYKRFSMPGTRDVVLGAYRNTAQGKWFVGAWTTNQIEAAPNVYYGAVDERVVAPIMKMLEAELLEAARNTGGWEFSTLVGLKNVVEPYRVP